MRLSLAAVYSFVVTLFSSSLYCLYGVAQAVSQRGDLSKFMGDWLVSTIVCFGIFTFIFYELGRLFDDLNKINRRRDVADENRNDDTKSASDCGDHRSDR